MKVHAFVAATLLVASTSATALVGCVPEPSIRVLSSNGVRAVVEEQTRDIEGAIGRSVSFNFSTASSLASQIENGEPFEEKMTRLVAELQAQHAEAKKLDAAIA